MLLGHRRQRWRTNLAWWRGSAAGSLLTAHAVCCKLTHIAWYTSRVATASAQPPSHATAIALHASARRRALHRCSGYREAITANNESLQKPLSPPSHSTKKKSFQGNKWSPAPHRSAFLPPEIHRSVHPASTLSAAVRRLFSAIQPAARRSLMTSSRGLVDVDVDVDGVGRVLAFGAITNL